MSQQDELTELLSQLAGSLRDEDLGDPEITVLLSQLVTIFEGRPEELPPELVEKLFQIKDMKKRFIQAAMAVGAGDANSLKSLTDSMEKEGLFKSDNKTIIQKVDRSAFIYMNPREKYYDNFAQCKTCMMFTGKTCTIHGPDVSVSKGDSCALYVPGDPMPKEKGHEMKSVTPEESGLYSGQVRCENCKYYKKGKQECGLYQTLNEKVSEKFNLQERVHPKACCNAFIEK